MVKEEIIERYREVKLVQRLLAIVLIASIYPIYDWYDQSGTLSLRLEDAKTRQHEAQQKNDGFKHKSAGLAALEEKLGAVREKLDKAKKRLPDKIELDKMLTKIGGIEKKVNVALVNFEPGVEIQPNKELKYAETPVTIQVKGSFSKIMRFYDELVHFDELTHLRDLTFTGNDTNSDKQSNAASTRKTESEVLAKASLVFFKNISE